MEQPPGQALYRLIWRWHFYAGLFCFPFVIWLSITGAIYLFHPQIDALLDKPYNHVATDAPHVSVAEQVRAALTTEPGTVLNAYQLPGAPGDAAQVLVGQGSSLQRVYVDPVTAKVIHSVDDDQRFTRILFHLHGELLLGSLGSALVELAACWMIVMLLSGLYLWWPRGRRLAGVVYPRLRAKGRLFWRDLHAVVGVWVSVFALFLLFTGLPWAVFWGGTLKDLRQWSAGHAITMDWTTGRASELTQRRAMNTPDVNEHADMPGMARPAAAMKTRSAAEPDYTPIDRIVATVARLNLPHPVLVSPPSMSAAQWTARSEVSDRPQRVNLVLDAQTGRVIKRINFNQRLFLDRLIGYGVAAHEGQLFGLANQLLGLMTAFGLITLSISALLLWWRRRPIGVLGAPAAVPYTPYPMIVPALLVLLGVYLPLLGISMVTLWALERGVLRHIPFIRSFLGLA